MEKLTRFFTEKRMGIFIDFALMVWETGELLLFLMVTLILRLKVVPLLSWQLMIRQRWYIAVIRVNYIIVFWMLP